MIRIGILGYGYWGPKIARIVAKADGCVLAGISDISGDCLAAARTAHRGVFLTGDWRELVSHPGIDALAIATPAGSHFENAMACIREGKHVLVEKPLARTETEVLRLMEESLRRRTVLMADHTFLFAPAVESIRELIGNRELGQLRYWDSQRLNRGIVRSDVNAAWDLASHDLSILDHVLPFGPDTVSASGWVPAQGTVEHFARISLKFPHNFVANIHASWISPVKVRRTVIGGDVSTLVYDDMETVNKLTVHGHSDVARTIGIMEAEPLGRAIAHFAECVSSGRCPISDGAAGLRIVRTLEAIDLSLKTNGRTVALEEGVYS